MDEPTVPPALEPFSDAVRAWFTTSFVAPTEAQAAAWGPISAGEHTLVCAPTGSGKTLSAFLWAVDSLGRRTEPSAGVSVVYVSPLRALAVDVDKNLRGPLRGVALAAERLGLPFRAPTVGVRTGDTPASERRALARRPPDVLITTPESLYLMLTSAARSSLASVTTVVVDEIHALAPTKRGAHLSLTLERLDHLVRAAGGEGPQRIGLSATQRPLEVVAAYLGGNDVDADGRVSRRPVRVVDVGTTKELDLSVTVAVEDMGALGEVDPGTPSGPAAAGPVRRSIWPAMHPLLLDLVESHRSTLVFVNARRTAERLASRLNELAHERASGAAPGAVAAETYGTVPEGVDLVRAHHGSLSRERRLEVEDQLKEGTLKGLVATSSLELGIDMGAVDLVVLVSSPGSVASGLQRVGRAGHQVGAPSRGRIFPKHRADLLECAVVVERMRAGLVEHVSVPSNPLDVLAQQLVAACALDEWDVDELAAVVRGSACFGELSDEMFAATLDLLAGRYPSEEFAELRPRVVWDRAESRVRGRAGAQRLAVTNAGTIPDRGLYGVFLADGTRVGELDEEMVHESRVGEVFLLGASTWRIEDITFDRVVVAPAPGRPGRMPFWRGDGPGRSAELGRALGEFVRTVRGLPRDEALARLEEVHALEPTAAANVLAYLEDQAAATGVVPDDRTVVVERFRDEIGDWRMCVHTPFGARVHAPWALVLRARLADHFGDEGTAPGGVEVLWSDDGIVVRLPEAATDVPLDVLVPSPEELDAELVAALPGTGMFAGRFREAAARALLLPRRRPDRRTPLWQQRQRAADLLAVAARYPSFPLLLEATRECCNDVFDLPALRQVLAEARSRRLRVVPVETAAASPFARSLLFGWVAVHMYSGDAPLAERRAAALTLDRELLVDLLGTEELRSLLDEAQVVRTDLELQLLTPDRAARDADEVHDAVRRLGPLRLDELAARTVSGAPLEDWVAELVASRRMIEVGMAGDRRLAAAEDAGRLRDALGVAIPVGLPAACTDPVDTPLRDLVERFARTHGPFTSTDVADRLGTTVEVAATVLRDLAAAGRVVAGEFRPGGRESEWCDAEVLRRLRRRSLAALRAEVEPVDAAALGRFLPQWQLVGSTRHGVDALAEVVGVLQGAALPASLLEDDVLGLRLGEYRPADLDQLCVGGEVVWIGAGGIGSHDGRVRLVFRDQVPLLVAPPDPAEGPDAPVHEALREHLVHRGASFWPELTAAVAAAELVHTDAEVLAALWDLVWAGEVTSDTVAPLRAVVAGGLDRRASGTRSRRPGAAVRRPSRTGPPAAAGRWSSTLPLFEPRPDPTAAATARAFALLDRYGVVTREMALAEGAEGGFAGVYPVLKVLEERGQVRRGYFVAGLGAAQFARPGAVDLLRATTDPHDTSGVEPLVLAATDPAQPWGASVPWPESAGRPSRSVGAMVVLVGGEPCAYVERGGRSLLTFPAAATHPGWVDALAGLVTSGRVRRLRVEQLDGAPAATSFWAPALRSAGFADGYKGLTLGR